ncbi:hypothetical protein D5H78_04650 [Vallicoccus soli]|uniref:Thiopeptide-type bacteriocin biosynthesis domain-containing protein n=1 Tax=Vallicoccus soli TaxID=2339232 RepID=A0A3A3Z652_9ACTN|nr:hypothetical protein D5H78_04650 [Vallicoccus soli]
MHTRGPVTLAWLSRTVVPVVRRLREQGAGTVYLRRGWRHGPHVDVVARDPRGAAVDWPALAVRLDAGPLDPAQALDEADYLDSARELGRLEDVPPPYLPLRPHGCVELLDAPAAASGDPRLDGLREVVANALCPVVVDTVDELAGHPDRGVERLAEAFAAVADTHALGAAYGVFSLRSHAEAFLAWTRPSRDLRPAFRERAARDAAVLRPVVERRLAGAPGPSGAAWRTALAYGQGVLDAAVAEGRLTNDLLDSVTAGVDQARLGPPGAATSGPAGPSPDSDFHRDVEASGVVAAPTEWFAAYRLLVNLFYQQLPLLTVSPLQRAYTCFAVAEAVDEVLGIPWQERLVREQLVQGGAR